MKIAEITIKCTNVTDQEIRKFCLKLCQRCKLSNVCIFTVTGGGIIKLIYQKTVYKLHVY